MVSCLAGWRPLGSEVLVAALEVAAALGEAIKTHVSVLSGLRGLGAHHRP